MLPIALFLNRMNRKGTDRSRDVLDEEYEWVFGKKRVDGQQVAEPARTRRIPVVRGIGSGELVSRHGHG